MKKISLLTIPVAAVAMLSGCVIQSVNQSPELTGIGDITCLVNTRVDLLDGEIYSLPPGIVEKAGKGCLKILHLPVRDYPLLLAFGNFVEFK